MTIESLPFNTKFVEPIKFDISIYPVSGLLTNDGVQYETVVTNSTTTYADLFSIDTDTFFPDLKGKLAWVYMNISMEFLGGSNTPIVTYKLEIKDYNASSWTIMSAQETYQTTTGYIGERLEGYIAIDTVTHVPFDIRVQFKSDGTGSTNMVSVKLKNDSCIRIVGGRETR